MTVIQSAMIVSQAEEPTRIETEEPSGEESTKETPTESVEDQSEEE
jgi:hypothetical protein